MTILGYLLSILVSNFVLVLCCLYFLRKALSSITSLRSSERVSRLEIIIISAIYLATIVIVPLLSEKFFNCDPVSAFLLDIAPPVLLIFLIGLSNLTGFYIARRGITRRAETAIADAPHIHLEDPFVKIVQEGNGGGSVILFLHIPFTVDKLVQAKSVRMLTPTVLPKNVKFSANPNPQSNIVLHEEPSFTFHILARECTKSPIPFNLSDPVTDDNLLELGKRYYLVRLLNFGFANCKASDYADFDPQSLNIKLDTARAENILQDESKV